MALTAVKNAWLDDVFVRSSNAIQHSPKPLREGQMSHVSGSRHGPPAQVTLSGSASAPNSGSSS